MFRLRPPFFKNDIQQKLAFLFVGMLNWLYFLKLQLMQLPHFMGGLVIYCQLASETWPSLFTRRSNSLSRASKHTFGHGGGLNQK